MTYYDDVCMKSPVKMRMYCGHEIIVWRKCVCVNEIMRSMRDMVFMNCPCVRGHGRCRCCDRDVFMRPLSSSGHEMYDRRLCSALPQMRMSRTRCVRRGGGSFAPERER